MMQDGPRGIASDLSPVLNKFETNASYLWAEIRALDPELDTGGTLKFSLAATAFCFALPSLDSRHAYNTVS